MRRFTVYFLLLWGAQANANEHWMSFTADNDAFVGKDNGYTNGLFLSFYDVGNIKTSLVTPSIWVTPLLWSLPTDTPKSNANAYSLGQTLTTPKDISVENPASNTLPYSALLGVTSHYLAIYDQYADRLSTTIGIIGPAAQGEKTQELAHRVISAHQPKGWHTQLHNEVVFSVSRARTWRYWQSQQDDMDVLFNLGVELGTLRSEFNTGVMIRYGDQLSDSYASTLLDHSRTSNPTMVNQGWYLYSGIKAKYILRSIFLDGNTFRHSRSIDYDRDVYFLTAGVVYSWGQQSLTFALNSPFNWESGNLNRDLDKYNQYGTLTFAWKL